MKKRRNIVTKGNIAVVLLVGILGYAVISTFTKPSFEFRPPERPSRFLCLMPQGFEVIPSDDPKVKVSTDSISIEQETLTIVVPRSLCLEVKER